MQREGVAITTETSFFNIEFVHAFLSKSYWAEHIPIETVQKSDRKSVV